MLTAAQIGLLTTEINNDPKQLGLVALKNVGDRAGIVAKLNATYPGVTTVWRTDVTAAELLACLVWSEVSTFTAAQWSACNTMLSPATVDASNTNIRAFFAGLFASKATTIANLTAIGQKANPTRAEELWGYGVRVSEQDVQGAIG